MEGKKVVSFLEDKLALMGLNAQERTDFITYWAPKMTRQKYCLIRFLFNEEFEKHAPLSIEPKPDTVFRVFMMWCPAENDMMTFNTVPQHIPSFSRKGFTAVEWGGTQAKMELFNK